MDGYIRGISAQRTSDGSIAVKWVWPSGYNCVRIVFLHRLHGREISELSAEELAGCSDLCFSDEFQIAGGRYIFPVGTSDAGLLKFRVYCCDSPESTDFTKSSDIAKITGITLKISYRTTEKKSGKTYKKITLSINSDADVPPGTLSYRVMPSGADYPINALIPAGASQTGPIITGVQESVKLGLAPGHDDEYVINAQ